MAPGKLLRRVPTPNNQMRAPNRWQEPSLAILAGFPVLVRRRSVCQNNPKFGGEQDLGGGSDPAGAAGENDRSPGAPRQPPAVSWGRRPPPHRGTIVAASLGEQRAPAALHDTMHGCCSGTALAWHGHAMRAAPAWPCHGMSAAHTCRRHGASMVTPCARAHTPEGIALPRR